MDIEIINNFMVDYIESKLTHIGVKIKIKGHIMPKLEGPKFDGIYGSGSIRETLIETVL
jgi:hypothetical protein